MNRSFKIGKRSIGDGAEPFVIAELSANHNQDIERAKDIVHAAADSGADAIKLQTYTPDTITLNADGPLFEVAGTIWEGRTLHELYQEAHLPWDWHANLFEVAESRGMLWFSTPFDFTAVEFLTGLNVPAFKVASSELTDIPLIRCIARTGKPILMSTGMGTLSEIDEAVKAARSEGCDDLLLLKCTAAYPAPINEANLRTIPVMSDTFACHVGLSDHTMSDTVPVVAVTLGARVIEKHLTLSRADGGPDSAFSLEPNEFASMVSAVRAVREAIGNVTFEPSQKELRSRDFRRSLFIVSAMSAGDLFTPDNLRSVRPAAGLHTRYYEQILGRRAQYEIPANTPLDWSMIKDRTS